MTDPVGRAAVAINTVALAGYLVWLASTEEPLWRGPDGLLHALPLLIFFGVYVWASGGADGGRMGRKGGG